MLFFIISAFFVIPPLLGSSGNKQQFSDWCFPLQQFTYALTAAAVLMFEKNMYNNEKILSVNNKKETPAPSRSVKKITFFTDTGSFLFTFGGLCTSAALLELAAYFSGNIESDIRVIAPAGFIQTFFCISNFAFSAFYEEVIYRFYLPAVFYKFSAAFRRTAKTARPAAEIIAALLFAFSHRYLGIYSVINAAAAHIFLRVCLKRTGSIWTGTAAHFCYNILSLLLLR